MNRLKLLAAGIAILSMVSMPTAASGQTRSNMRSAFMSEDTIRTAILRVERKTNSFRETYERRMRDYFVPNIDKSDRERARIQKLDRAMEDTYRLIHTAKPRFARDHVQRVVAAAREVDAMFLFASPVLVTLREDWEEVRADIDELAGAYNLASVQSRSNLRG